MAVAADRVRSVAVFVDGMAWHRLPLIAFRAKLINSGKKGEADGLVSRAHNRQSQWARWFFDPCEAKGLDPVAGLGTLRASENITHMPRLKVRGVDLYFEQVGKGPALLCLPGALGTGITDFAPQLTPWSAHFSVVAPDPRGYGRSRPPDRDFPSNFLERDADDMAALMAAIGFDTFAVAGFSDGANTGALLASKYPERVLKLVIWAGNSFISEEDMASIEMIRNISTWSPQVRKMLGSVYGDSLQELWSLYYDGFRRIYREGGQICRERLGMIHCQTLILHGVLDPLVPAFHAEILRREIRSSHLHVFPEGRHNIHFAHADEFNELVLRFLLR